MWGFIGCLWLWDQVGQIDWQVVQIGVVCSVDYVVSYCMWELDYSCVDFIGIVLYCVDDCCWIVGEQGFLNVVGCILWCCDQFVYVDE